MNTNMGTRPQSKSLEQPRQNDMVQGIPRDFMIKSLVEEKVIVGKIC